MIEILVHLELSRLLVNSPTHRSTSLLPRLDLEISLSLANPSSRSISKLSEKELFHYLVLQQRNSSVARAKIRFSSPSMGTEKLLSILYMVTTETTRILVHLVKLHSLESEIPEKLPSTDTMETTKTLVHQEHLHSRTLHLFIQKSITLHTTQAEELSTSLAALLSRELSQRLLVLDRSSDLEQKTKHMREQHTSVSVLQGSSELHLRRQSRLNHLAYTLLSFNFINNSEAYLS